MSDITIWHDPLSDTWTVSDGSRTEIVSPLVRRAMCDEHDRETAALRGSIDRLQAENAKLRELCADMWGWLTARTVSGAALHDISGRMRELGVSADG